MNERDYHTICINHKGPVAHILKLFNGISSLLCFMFIFSDTQNAKIEIDKSYTQYTSGVGEILSSIAIALV